MNGKTYWTNNPEKAESIGESLVEISKRIKYKKGEAHGTYLKAMAQWYLEKYSESLENIAEAQFQYQLINNEEGIAACYNSFGMIYHQVGDDGEALEYFFKALKVSDEIGYELGEAKTLQNIGVVYREQGDLDLSLSYFKKSIPLMKGKENILTMGNDHANIALNFHLMGLYDSALFYYSLAYQGFTESNNIAGLIKYYEKIGDLYLDIGFINEAEQSFIKGMEISKEKNLKEGIIANSEGLIKTWDQSEKSHLSDSLIKVLEPEIRMLKNPRTKMHWYSNLSDHYQITGDFGKSLAHFKYSSQLKDSLLGLEQKTLINQLKAVHDLESIQQENEVLKRNLDITKKMNLGVALALIIFLGLLIMISRFYNLKQKANQRLSDLNQQLRNQRRETEIKAQELQEANKTISSINSELEKIIGERTAELKKKNKKILDFAFFNSHQVRGSLARIMGLLEVFNESSGKKETKSVSELLRSQAGELDDLIRDINRILAEEGYSEDNPS